MPRTVVEDAVEVLFDEDARIVVAENPDRPVVVDHLRARPTAFEAQVLRGALELPALIMAPPAIVELPAPEQRGGEFEVHGGFAVDLLALKRDKTDFTAKIECSVDIVESGDSGSGRRVFSVILDADSKNPAEVGWAEILDPSTGMAPRVRAGQRVRLETRVVEGSTQGSTVTLGVGGLSLRSVREFEATRASTSKPNVVLVVMDTLRADHTSTFGYRFQTTPRLDQFAASGVAYDDARSTSSWTWPSTASILTGLAPAEHGVERPGSSWLRGALVTLAEYMQREGLATAAFSGNRLVSPDFHFDQGFQTFEGPPRNDFIDGAELMPDVHEWIEEHADERFFPYVHLVDPHWPYDPLPASVVALPGEAPKKWRKIDMSDHLADLYAESESVPGRLKRPLLKSLVREVDLMWLDRGYDQAIHTGDIWFGALLDQLEDLGLTEETLVVFTSDHGEEAYEHGDSSHGQSLFPELIHVPLVIAGPGVPAGRRITGPVSNQGLFDYLASLGQGVELGEERVPLAELGAPVFYSTERGQWAGEHDQTILGIEESGWVLQFAVELDEVRLFDMASDPQQHTNLATQEPERVESMKAALIAHIAEVSERRLDSGVLGAGEGAIEALEDIGYL